MNVLCSPTGPSDGSFGPEGLDYDNLNTRAAAPR